MSNLHDDYKHDYLVSKDGLTRKEPFRVKLNNNKLKTIMLTNIKAWAYREREREREREQTGNKKGRQADE